jgi:hypothetical protein
VNVYRLSWWSVASVVLNVPWIWAVIWVLGVYAAHNKVAGEVWLTPILVWGIFWLATFATAFVGIANVRRSNNRLRGQWIAALGLGLWAVFPLSGFFWRDLIRFAQQT